MRKFSCLFTVLLSFYIPAKGDTLNIRSVENIDHGNLFQKGTIAWHLKNLDSKVSEIHLQSGPPFLLESEIILPQHIKISFDPGAYFMIRTKGFLDIRGPLQEQLSKMFENEGVVFLRKVEAINPIWFGATGDGIQDDGPFIQDAIDAASNMLELTSFPPAGASYPPPIVRFTPGSYRITSQLSLTNGLTFSGTVTNPYTVGHTRIIMDWTGRDQNILNLQTTYRGVKRTKLVTTTIQDLEFWYVPQGASVTNIVGIGAGEQKDLEPKNQGSAIYLNEDSCDIRVKRCNFYQSPNAAIFLDRSPTKPNSIRSLVIDESEFDTGNYFLRAHGVWLDVAVNDSKFFSGSDQVLITHSTGNFAIQSSEFEWNARIRILDSHLETFRFNNNRHEDSRDRGFIYLDGSKTVSIGGNTFGKSTCSTLKLSNVAHAVISSNTFFDPALHEKEEKMYCGQSPIELENIKSAVITGNSFMFSDKKAEKKHSKPYTTKNVEKQIWENNLINSL